MSDDWPSGHTGRLLADLAPGALVAGYRLEARIGAGGMAVVFRARDERLGRTVALKVLAPALAGDGQFRERFIRESQRAAAVDHPHIIPVYGAGDAGGVLYLAMRLRPRRRPARRTAPGRPAAGRPGRVPAVPGRVGARRGARRRAGAPGREARQRPGRHERGAARPPVPVGLRARQGRRVGDPPDRDRAVPRHDRVRRAGAGFRPARPRPRPTSTLWPAWRSRC